MDKVANMFGMNTPNQGEQQAEQDMSQIGDQGTPNLGNPPPKPVMKRGDEDEDDKKSSSSNEVIKLAIQNLDMRGA